MISIFAKRAFYNINPSEEYDKRTKPLNGRGHLMRVSSIIRADQIAKRLKIQLNPTCCYKHDVCIYVKPMVRRGEGLKFEGKRSYLDIIDGWGLIPLLEKHPDVGVIVCSRQDEVTLTRFLPNKIVFIPQHHCNFDREKRTRKGIKTVGVIGTAGAFAFLPKDLKMKLAERGIDLLAYSRFLSQKDIIDFYKQIDVQIVWRPYRMRLSNPLKLVNAASFGIPTIALAEDVFKELEGCYIGVKDLDGFLRELDRLIEKPEIYSEISENCLKKAEEYHIDNVAKLYLTL